MDKDEVKQIADFRNDVYEGIMQKSEWVRSQFGLPKRRKWQYRDVLLITSFIEAVIRGAAPPNISRKRKSQKVFKQDFKPSLEALGLRIDCQDERKSAYEQNCQYQDSCLIEINVVRVQRNDLLHTILREDWSVKGINDEIKQMARNIRHICTESRIVRDYFKANYQFDPAEVV